MANKEVKKYKLYASHIQGVPEGVKYSFVPSSLLYLLVYTDTPPIGRLPFTEIDETKIGLSTEERGWLSQCKAVINAAAMRESEQVNAETLNIFLDKVEENLEEQIGRLESTE